MEVLNVLEVVVVDVHYQHKWLSFKGRRRSMDQEVLNHPFVDDVVMSLSVISIGMVRIII